jgi:phage FluMu gp28-like protein
MKKASKKISSGGLGDGPQVESAVSDTLSMGGPPPAAGPETCRANLHTGKAPTSVGATFGNSNKGAKKVGGGAAVSANNTAAPGPGERSGTRQQPRPTEPVKAPPLTHAALDRSIPRGTKLQAAQLANEALIKFRSYQDGVFKDRETGLLILHWSRQIGKSYTLAAWAVDRLLSQLLKYDTWLVTVLSNSRDNGAEFALKCAEVCNKIGLAKAAANEIQTVGDAAVYVQEDASPDLRYENMRMEIRITMVVNGRERVGRIKVLAANPRTARGFSGDLILDEFAFHEDSNAIWEAAEPILSANPEFMCRIASTGNGKHNMFYRMCSGDGPSDGTLFESANGFSVSRVTRTEAWKQGVKIWDMKSKPRKSITPEEAFAKAMDKRSYLQNYECAFNDENMRLLTAQLISSAESSLIPIDEQRWTPATIARMCRAEGDLYVGQDIGRNRDLSVVFVLEKAGLVKRVIAVLRMSGMRLPAQQEQLAIVCRLPKFRVYCGDMTGLGLGLVEYLQEAFGEYRIKGVNFSTTEPITESMQQAGDKRLTARVTEIMATRLLEEFEQRSLKDLPNDSELREDLEKPEKITSPGGKVSIAAVRDEAGHADHFWALALAVRAAQEPGGVLESAEGIRTGRVTGRRPQFKPRIWRAA